MPASPKARNVQTVRRHPGRPPARAPSLAVTLLGLTLAFLLAAGLAKEEEIINSTTPECEEVLVPMCRGLVDYNYTRLPNRFNHTSQVQVYWALQPWWPFMDTGCSDNLRTYLCSLYLPRCTPGSPALPTDPPCRKTCKKAQARCSAVVKHHKLQWTEEMNCDSLPGSKKVQGCIRPKRETNKKQRRQVIECQANPIAMCQHLPFTLASLPNPFMQSDLEEIATELRQYRAIVESGCSTRLPFLLCGSFMPFCIHGTNRDQPYVVPCREVCHQVRNDCRRQFHDAWGGLPWPSKLHCHRYPSHTSKIYLQQDNSSVPCVMPPVGF